MVEEGNADSFFTCPASPACPMDVVIDFLRWLELDDQVYRRNVEAPGRYICGNQAFYFSSFEIFESILSLTLGDVPMQQTLSLN